MYSCGPPSHERPKIRRSVWTYLQQLYADTGCSLDDLPGAMDDRYRWRERVREIHASRKSSLWGWWWHNKVRGALYHSYIMFIIKSREQHGIFLLSLSLYLSDSLSLWFSLSLSLTFSVPLSLSLSLSYTLHRLYHTLLLASSTNSTQCLHGPDVSFVCRPTLMSPCVKIHLRKLHISSSLLL